MISRFQQLGLHLRGYKKVMLNDTKGLLTNANNFKFIKSISSIVDAKDTVLPSGTKISEIWGFDTYTKKVTKSDGTVFQYTRGLFPDEWILKKGTANNWDNDARIIKGSASGKDFSPSEIRFLNNRKRHT